jgi:tight adherence protein C
MTSNADVSAIAIALLAFLAVSMFVIGLVRFYFESRVNRSLHDAVTRGDRGLPVNDEPTQNQRSSKRLRKVLMSLSHLTVPKEGWQDDAVRLKFLQAGLSDPESPVQYYALKTILTAILPFLFGGVLLLLRPDTPMFLVFSIVVVLAAMGYYLPEYYLRHRTESRVNEMRSLLPDVIDLLVICTESGLSLDQALSRVSQEVARTSPMVASEFHLVTLEIRAGAGRSDALRNLSLRVKLDDLSNLASMMIQADRFGTGIAEALRIQSETMRIRRMQRAEEAAAKIPTKMLMPLVFLIFPALMIVILGPAIIKLSEVFSENPPWR